MDSLTWSSGTAASLALDILKGALVAFVASWLTVKGAVRQFSSQRWWERQEEAYRKIIEGLSGMQVTLSRIDNSGAAFVEEEGQIEMWSQLMKTIDYLTQSYQENAFRISTRSTEVLKKFVSNWYPAPPVGEGALHQEMLDRYHELIDECLPIIITEARRDLRLPPQR